MLKTSVLISDHMVLQRGMEIPLWGTYTGKGTVTVRLGELEVEAKQEGENWKAKLPPLPVMESETLYLVSEEETLEIHDVAVGEVWVAGGQSNMEFPMLMDDGYKAEMELCENRYIRFFDYPEIVSSEQLEERDYSKYGIWRSCDREQLKYFSAVGYYFAKEIQNALHVPVGIIGCNWGGTPACSWIKEEFLEQSEAGSWIENYQEQIKNLDLADYTKRMKENPAWYRNNYIDDPMNIMMLSNKTEKEQEEFERRMEEQLAEMEFDPIFLCVGPLSERRPSVLYHSMVESIVPYGMRGVIWYQGESDDEKAEIYDKTLTALIKCWRAAWGKDFPFLLVQLASFEHWLQCSGERYPVLRACQQTVADTVSDVYMASIMDAGVAWDIHPKEKAPVGKRLGLLARGKVYEEDLLCEPPYGKTAVWEGERIRVDMENAGEGLTLKGETVQGLCVLEQGKELQDLEVLISGHCLYIDGLPESGNYEIEFAMKPYEKVNLYNSAGLPAKPFRLSL